jgi:outer membrane protein assembly factor BamB
MSSDYRRCRALVWGARSRPASAAPRGRAPSPSTIAARQQIFRACGERLGRGHGEAERVGEARRHVEREGDRERIVFEAEACQQVSAFDAVSGTRLWYHSTSCTGGGGAAPSVYQGSIWVRDWALGNIVLDEGDGHPVGSFAADVMPALMNGRGYYLKSSSLSAVDIASSTLLWTFSGDGSLNTVPVVAGGRGQVFVGSSSGNVYELDAATGAQLSVAAAGAPVTASSETVAMALANGTLVVPAGHLLVAF